MSFLGVLGTLHISKTDEISEKFQPPPSLPRQRQQREARPGAQTAQLLVQGVHGGPGETQICSGLLQTTCQSTPVSQR